MASLTIPRISAVKLRSLGEYDSCSIYLYLAYYWQAWTAKGWPGWVSIVVLKALTHQTPDQEMRRCINRAVWSTPSSEYREFQRIPIVVLDVGQWWVTEGTRNKQSPNTEWMGSLRTIRQCTKMVSKVMSRLSTPHLHLTTLLIW